ncbi:MFS general substrate transporter [Cystobasidium minutum MCA 4210]|uniref:MFS general substrate transporter n=1 Tax=Cystobasidium minutum MCA 4210 TaxID=1397322 RepID=UPI0034CFA3FA|eukprot:jgi/Rhomi1/196901/gm1.5115_g
MRTDEEAQAVAAQPAEEAETAGNSYAREERAAEAEKPTRKSEDAIVTEEDRIEVKLEGKEHPWNWTKTHRWFITIQAALMIFSATITSSAPSGGARVFSANYGTSREVTGLLVSVFLVGYSVGPFVTAPSSETWGRRPPSIVFMALYTIFNGACAACSSIVPLLVCRFLAGACASGPIATSGTIVTDIWAPKDRGMVMSLWSIGSFAGPSLGPIVGGFIAISGLNVRWIFIVMTLLSGSLTILIFFALPETYVPLLVHRKAQKLREETKDPRYYAKFSEDKGSAWKKISVTVTRPFKIFFKEPILVLSTIYSSFAYAVLYMLFPLYPIIFQDIRGLQEGVGDLPFLATLGGVLAAVPIQYLYQFKYLRDLKANHGKHTPELRLAPTYLGGPVMVVALLWLGWTGYKANINAAVPTLSGLLTGISSVLIFRSFSTYVMECYKDYSASAMAAVVVFRSLFGAGLPIAVDPMVRAIGVQWSATLLAAFQLLLVPVPFLFYKYGVKIRARSPYSADEK